jgi:acyl-CoA synthetase (AMP-forming)/AMP-acid ligase II
VALDFGGHAYTFGDVEARSNRLANLLAACGLVCEDRLCVHLANSVEMIDLFLACVKLGVIFVPINILYRDGGVWPESFDSRTVGLRRSRAPAQADGVEPRLGS